MSAVPSIPYPVASAERTRWIIERRGEPNEVDSERPYAFFNEQEPVRSGEIVDAATILLTNRECPWKCVMCDLWRNTLPETVPAGAIARQIEFALSRLKPASMIKLYNSGSFFDEAAISPGEYEAIAALCAEFDHIVVECHPRLVSPRMLEFTRRPAPSLEVAMGLETAEPSALERLNKRFTLGGFKRAAEFLHRNGFALRTFLMVHPPFIARSQAAEWARRSIDFAWECGSSVVSLIPARAGNGAMDELARLGEFAEPAIAELEEGLEYGLSTRRGRVFADLWDLQRFSNCVLCFERRRTRLARMNLSQQIEPPVECASHE